MVYYKYLVVRVLVAPLHYTPGDSTVEYSE
jgi:hypothetical protein